MTNNTSVVFQKLRKMSESGHEYWSARDLSEALEYLSFRNFEPVLEKAKEACKNSGLQVDKHFVSLDDAVSVGKGAKREVTDILLTRYACYLVVQNADPSKEVVALGQTYFAVQTRKQEAYAQGILEDEKRVHLREDISSRNKRLAQTASKAGVRNYGIFTNSGYRGLYGGLTEQDIHRLKELNKNQRILDHMGSEELAANIFRVSQADAKIDREGIFGEAGANQVRFEVGKKVRKVIKEMGGTVPEKLPRVDDVKDAKKRLKAGSLGKTKLLD